MCDFDVTLWCVIEIVLPRFGILTWIRLPCFGIKIGSDCHIRHAKSLNLGVVRGPTSCDKMCTVKYIVFNFSQCVLYIYVEVKLWFIGIISVVMLFAVYIVVHMFKLWSLVTLSVVVLLVVYNVVSMFKLWSFETLLW